MSIETPVRNPDLRSPQLMTRRAWWLVGLNLVIPGSAQVLAGSRRLGRFGLGATLVLWLLLVVAGVLALVARGVLIDVVTNPIVLWILAAGLAFYAVLWVVLTLDTLRLVRLVRVSPNLRGLVGGIAVLGLVVTAGAAGYGAASATSAAGLVSAVFGDGSVEPPIDGRYNILLLGGDAGPDRLGLRPDSISVASVDAETGAVVLIGIPRALYSVPFAEGSPLWDAYPDGYDCGDDCLIDYIYTYGEEHPDLYPEAEREGSTPGVEAMRDAVEGVLGIPLQYYVLIDMQGFSDLVDALGGIDIDVPERVAIGANTYPDGSPAPPGGYIEAGPQHMDGGTALWYARSRYGVKDTDRMARQRQVQEALIAQADPATVVTRFGAIAAAGQEVVRTDIPQAMLSSFVGLAQRSTEHEVTSLDIVPPEFDNVNPDFDAIRARVQELLHPGAGAE